MTREVSKNYEGACNVDSLRLRVTAEIVYANWWIREDAEGMLIMLAV